MRAVASVLVALALFATPPHAQTPEPPRAFLLFVDDLHLHFRETPRARWAMQRALATLGRDGDVWSVATTGTSNVSLAPTTDIAAVRAAIARVVGNTLTGREAVATGSHDHTEGVETTALNAIGRLASHHGGNNRLVLYVTQDADVAPPVRVLTAAADANAQLIVVPCHDLDFRLGAKDEFGDALAGHARP